MGGVTLSRFWLSFIAAGIAACVLAACAPTPATPGPIPRATLTQSPVNGAPPVQAGSTSNPGVIVIRTPFPTVPYVVPSKIPRPAQPPTPRPTQTPPPTPIPAGKSTFKEAFALLLKASGMPDLAFYSYDASNVDAAGLSALYTIAGFSASQGKLCTLTLNSGGGRLSCASQSSASPLADISTLKDSPEMIQTAFKNNNPCPDSNMLTINLAEGKVEVDCYNQNWGFLSSPFK